LYFSFSEQMEVEAPPMDEQVEEQTESMETEEAPVVAEQEESVPSTEETMEDTPADTKSSNPAETVEEDASQETNSLAQYPPPNYAPAVQIPTVTAPEVDEDLVAPLYTTENEEIARPDVLICQVEEKDLSGEKLKKYLKHLDHRALVDFFAKYLHKHDLPIDHIVGQCKGSVPEDTTVIEKNKVYVRFLSKDTTEEEFKAEFEKIGEVKEVSIPRTFGNKSKGFGFVTFETEATAKEAVEKGKLSFHDQECSIELAREKRDFARRGRGRGGRRGGRGGRGRGRGYGNYNRGYNNYSNYNRGWGNNQGYGNYGGYNQGYGNYGGYNQGYNQGGYSNYNQGYNNNNYSQNYSQGYSQNNQNQSQQYGNNSYGQSQNQGSQGYQQSHSTGQNYTPQYNTSQ